MPRTEPIHSLRQQKILDELPLERNHGIVGRLEKPGKITAHELRSVRVIDWSVVQIAVSIVDCLVENRTAEQRREPGNGLPCPVRRAIQFLQTNRESFLLEIMPDLQRVAEPSELGPSLGQFDATVLQSPMPDLILRFARPHPLHAQRRLAPSFSRAAGRVRDARARAGASHRSHRLRPELQRDAHVNRDEIQARADDADVSCFAHESTTDEHRLTRIRWKREKNLLVRP